ncbi:MAG: hypothetical protein JWM80_1265 [Cyanobacteria bacterium RYN_339]|nr:hypothetical protein [Cyanobacteria bacterium RYN_339]
MKINPMIISHLLPSLRGLGVSRVLATGEADCPTLWIEHPSVREARNEVVHQLVEFEIEHPDVCFVYEIVGRGDQRSELTRGNPEVLFQ